MLARFALIAGLTLLLSGCATVPNPFAGAPAGSSTPASAAATPAAAPMPAAPAGAAPSHDPRVKALVAAGTKPLGATEVGSYMDEEEAALRAQLQTSGVSVTRIGQQIVLKVPAAISFDTGDVTLRGAFKPTLSAIGGLLKKYNRTVVDVYGFTDDQSSDQQSKALSQKRAVAVAAVLAAAGVDQRRFYVEGKGEANPVAPNTSEVGRAQNRRVEIQLSPIS
jgi:outer membrane protein OmpA-like peptidoglycan-associated protein